MTCRPSFTYDVHTSNVCALINFSCVPELHKSINQIEYAGKGGFRFSWHRFSHKDCLVGWLKNYYLEGRQKPLLQTVRKLPKNKNR